MIAIWWWRVAYLSEEERERAEYMWRWQQSERRVPAINYIIAKLWTWIDSTMLEKVSQKAQSCEMSQI